MHEHPGTASSPKRVEEPIIRALDRGCRRLALKLMMRIYGPTVLARCRQLLRPDRSAAEDVRQIVFVQAYRDLDRYQRRSSVRGWLLAIARNRCIDYARKRGRDLAVDRGVDPTEVLERMPTDDEQPEHALARVSTAQHLEDCLHRLQPAVSGAVLLRFREGYSYVEMARILDAKPPALQTRVARALPKLRRCLERKGVNLGTLSAI